MIYELNTDEFYAYGHIYEPCAWIDSEIELKEPVDEEKLSKAVSMAFLKIPYYKVRISTMQNPERYVLETYPNSFPITRRDDFMELSDADSGGYLITITYFLNTIRLRASHVLCDAYAMNLFISFFLCSYFGNVDRYYIPACFMDQGKTDDKYANPFDYIQQPDESYKIKDVSSFSFETEDISDTQISLTRIGIPGDRYLSFAKANESSVAAVGAWILMNVIYRVKENVSMPISVAIPCNMRKILGCERNMRNCNIDLILTMHKRMMDKCSDYQLSCLRSQLFAQMYEPAAISRMMLSKVRWLQACNLKSIRERTENYKAADVLDGIPIVSYVGSLDVGEYKERIEAFHQHVRVLGKAGILMVITYHNDMFELNITSNLKNWHVYQDAMIDFLKKNGLPAYVVNNERI